MRIIISKQVGNLACWCFYTGNLSFHLSGRKLSLLNTFQTCKFWKLNLPKFHHKFTVRICVCWLAAYKTGKYLVSSYQIYYHKLIHSILYTCFFCHDCCWQARYHDSAGISISVLFPFALVIIAPIPEAKVCRKYVCDKTIQSVAVWL